MNDELNLWEALGVLAILGVVIAIGKLLVSNEKFSWHLAIGRAIVSAGLSVAAGSILAFIPGVSMLAVIGLACASAVLGEQFLERLIQAKASGG
ncbi:phage holin family protein [Achromobacter aegrifaciens]